MEVKVKADVALPGTPSHGYGTLFAIWDHNCLYAIVYYIMIACYINVHLIIIIIVT